MKCKKIKKIVDNYFMIDISKKSRRTDYIKGRSIYYQLALKYSTDKFTYTDISKLVNKDHCALIYAKKTHASFYFCDKSYIEAYEYIDEYINNIYNLNKCTNKKVIPKNYAQKYKTLYHKYIDVKNKYDELIGLDIQ